MFALLDRMKKEWAVIKGAPFSFVIVCVIAIGLCFSGFRWIYREKLVESEKRGQQWKTDVEYWKDLASRPKLPEKQQDEIKGVPVSPKKKIVTREAPSTTITGNQNIVGNNNQMTIGSAPSPPRHLTEDQWTLFRKFAATTPGTVNILAIHDDQEAWDTGQTIGENLRKAGWTVIQVTTFSSLGGPPEYGLTVAWPGERVVTSNGKILLNTGTAGGALAIGLMQVFEEVYSNPNPGPDAPIFLYVNKNPKAKAK